MAIQNREKPGIIPLADFNPGNISPGEIVIVEDAGKRMPYIGLAAGGAVRLASYDEVESVSIDARRAADKAGKHAADVSLLHELVQKAKAEAEETAKQAAEAVRQAEATLRQARELTARLDGFRASVLGAFGGGANADN